MNPLDTSLARELLPSSLSQTALVLDADRTLGPHDTGRLVGRHFGLNDRIRGIFEAHGYTEEAFRSVACTWAEVPKADYLQEVERSAREVELHPGWMSLLPELCRHVQVVVVTSGIPQIWRLVLRAAGVDEVPVLGGCHSGLDSYFVCPLGKSAVVKTLQRNSRRVVAVGDSEIDLPMLLAADRGFMVPDQKGSPRLRRALEQTPHSIKHLGLDSREFEVPRITIDEFASLLMDQTC